MIQPIIRVGSKELILNQTFLIEEKSESLDIDIPIFNIASKKNEAVKIKFNFCRDKTKKEKILTFVKNNILNIDIKLPDSNKNILSTFTTTPTKFNIGNKTFSIYIEIVKMKEILYKMTVSIYIEEKK